MVIKLNTFSNSFTVPYCLTKLTTFGECLELLNLLKFPEIFSILSTNRIREFIIKNYKKSILFHQLHSYSSPLLNEVYNSKKSENKSLKEGNFVIIQIYKDGEYKKLQDEKMIKINRITYAYFKIYIFYSFNINWNNWYIKFFYKLSWNCCG